MRFHDTVASTCGEHMRSYPGMYVVAEAVVPLPRPRRNDRFQLRNTYVRTQRVTPLALPAVTIGALTGCSDDCAAGGPIHTTSSGDAP